MSWDASTMATTRPSKIDSAVWSPCDRFIAITWYNAKTVDVLDSATLQRLQTLESSQDVPTTWRVLAFSPDSRILTCCSGRCSNSLDEEPSVVSWDLQTGGVANVVRLQPKFVCPMTRSITYSVDGKIAGVLYHHWTNPKNSTISVIDVASGTLMHSHLLENATPLSKHIWTYGTSLRFATVDAMAITIWEVAFTSSATPTKVKIFPSPVDFNGKRPEDAQLHPTTYRLAFVSQQRILVWDVQNSRYLLESADAEFSPKMSFSSDGRFFTCATKGSKVYLWKETSAGYILHGILVPNTEEPTPLLARNGKSILAFGGCTIQLWHTKSLTTPPPSILTQAPRRDDRFIVEFSSDDMFAVVAEKRDNTVTVLNLKFGVPWLTIDTSMNIFGLGVIGNAVVVIGIPKVIAWNLPAGDCVSHGRVGLEGSSWTIDLEVNPSGVNLGDSIPFVDSASISSNSRHIALKCYTCLFIFNGSTGECVGGIYNVPVPDGFCLSPDGCEVWSLSKDGGARAWRVGSRQEVLKRLMDEVDMEHPPEGYPWVSSRGYRVTDDWWILGPDGRRLLMLPPPWQSYAVQRVWKGRFLALLHGGLSEPVILEFEE